MKIVVFGASGGTGRATVERALAAGHHVTAVVRRPDALPPRPGLDVAVLATLSDEDAVAGVVQGHDAVVSALGTHEKGPVRVCADGIDAILGAMTRAGVRRLIAVSAHGAADSRDRSLYCLALWAALSHKMRDKEQMEQAIQASGTDWTIVRAAALNDKPYTGRYRTGTDLKIRLTSAVGRADLGDFLVRESTEPSYAGQLPRIAA
jgi:uncharacterized protein YbjT (DUF2867 family)